jgi:hypothetical protein
MESQLVEATWGLVAATSLLFLASVVPAVGQFISWSNRKKSLASDLIPTLHRIRKRATDMRSALLSLTSPVSSDDIMPIENDASSMRDDLKKIENHENLSLGQRLEIYVLSSQMPTLGFHLSWLYSPGDPDEEQSIISDEERLRQSIIICQAALLSLDRLDRLFAGVRKKYQGRTFTEEMFARNSQDRDEAEKQLVDIRRKLHR